MNRQTDNDIGYHRNTDVYGIVCKCFFLNKTSFDTVIAHFMTFSTFKTIPSYVKIFFCKIFQTFVDKKSFPENFKPPATKLLKIQWKQALFLLKVSWNFLIFNANFHGFAIKTLFDLKLNVRFNILKFMNPKNTWKNINVTRIFSKMPLAEVLMNTRRQSGYYCIPI